MLDITEQDYLNLILAFDYGDVRIGVAIKPANQASAEPLVTIQNDANLWQTIEKLLQLHSPSMVVVGRPRNLEGDNTAQTDKAERFARQLARRYNNKVELQDEALTTEQAKQRIPKNLAHPARGVIDQYAACIILESYLQEK